MHAVPLRGALLLVEGPCSGLLAVGIEHLQLVVVGMRIRRPGEPKPIHFRRGGHDRGVERREAGLAGFDDNIVNAEPLGIGGRAGRNGITPAEDDGVSRRKRIGQFKRLGRNRRHAGRIDLDGRTGCIGGCTEGGAGAGPCGAIVEGIIQLELKLPAVVPVALHVVGDREARNQAAGFKRKVKVTRFRLGSGCEKTHTVIGGVS